MIKRIISRFQNLLYIVFLSSVLIGPANAYIASNQIINSKQIDVVIALDVSSSMSGLIDSAKQRLWDIVNELGRAQPQPQLRLAILSFGNPNYGSEGGFVRVDLPFTDDLDLVNKTLFEFGTNGGDEFVARAISTAVQELDWTSDADAMRVLFVAGNEGAHQDPQIPVSVATREAARMGIVVNTIYCGGENDGDAKGWRQVANLGDGIYASINQNASAVANIATPMDDEIIELNTKLNGTYVAYGKDGEKKRSNQIEQDANADAMSTPASASRTVSKASGLYKNGHWDLVDAIDAGTSLDDIENDELPAEMQDMNIEQRTVHLEQKKQQRTAIQSRIQQLAAERRQYVAEERAKLGDSEEQGLDQVVQSSLQALAEKKGFTFAEK